MNIIRRLFGKSDETGEVLCPRCEKPVSPDHQCAGMSRRFFFGVLAGTAAAIVVGPEIVKAATVELPAPYDKFITEVGFTFKAEDRDINALLKGAVDRGRWYYYDTITLPDRVPVHSVQMPRHHRRRL